MTMIRLAGLILDKTGSKPETKQPAPIVECIPDTDANGMISPSDLHSHFDCNGDGKVDVVDYAAHILFHIENPQYLRAFNAAAQERMVQSPLAARMNKFVNRGATPGPSTFSSEN